MPGQARELRSAKRQLRGLKDDWRRHRQLCNCCTQLRHDASKWCSKGWMMHKQIRDMEQLVRVLAAEAQGQAGLFPEAAAGV